MGSVHDIFPTGRQPRDNDGEPPGPPDMEPRIERLEAIAEKTGERLAAIEKDIAVLKANSTHYATKADVADAKSSIIMWVVSAILLAQLLPAILKKFGL
jgi:hypothetical protein